MTHMHTVKATCIHIPFPVALDAVWRSSIGECKCPPVGQECRPLERRVCVHYIERVSADTVVSIASTPRIHSGFHPHVTASRRINDAGAGYVGSVGDVDGSPIWRKGDPVALPARVSVNDYARLARLWIETVDLIGKLRRALETLLAPVWHPKAMSVHAQE